MLEFPLLCSRDTDPRLGLNMGGGGRRGRCDRTWTVIPGLLQGAIGGAGNDAADADGGHGPRKTLSCVVHSHEMSTKFQGVSHEVPLTTSIVSASGSWAVILVRSPFSSVCTSHARNAGLMSALVQLLRSGFHRVLLNDEEGPDLSSGRP